jgi:hypothetical protein
VWTFTATIDDTAEVLDITGDGNGDRCGEVANTQPPALESQYSFRVDRVEDPDSDGLIETYAYLGSSAEFFDVKISEGGGGDCEGILEFKSADSTQWWTFNPNICTSANCQPPSNTITGTGDFTAYLEPQPYPVKKLPRLRVGAVPWSLLVIPWAEAGAERADHPKAPRPRSARAQDDPDGRQHRSPPTESGEARSMSDGSSTSSPSGTEGPDVQAAVCYEGCRARFTGAKLVLG